MFDSPGARERDLECLAWAGVLATEACLEELGVRIGGSNPVDLTGDNTILAQFNAWVGGMWRTFASVNPPKEDPSEPNILRG